MIQEQAHQKGISSSLWGIALFLQCLGLLLGDLHGYSLLSSHAYHLSFLVYIPAFFMSVAADHLDKRIVFCCKHTCLDCQPCIDLDGRDVGIDRSDRVALV